jgi:N-acetyl-anhydromuramyl-L-alanine amidase AmpD
MPIVGPPRPTINDLVDELPVHPTKRFPSRSLTDITQIVVHHTGTKPTITPRRLAEYQVKTQDRAGIIYHFVVGADGVIYQTNELETVSEHALSHSQVSVGICFTGTFSTVIPSTAQIQAGGKLCAWLLGHLRLPISQIVGMSELAKTQSPGKQWLGGQRWKDQLLAEVQATLEEGGEDQSIIIISLQERIKNLEEEIERLKEQGRVDPESVSVQEILDHLSGVIASLQAQIEILQEERDRLQDALKAALDMLDKDQLALLASLRERIKTLQTEKDALEGDLAEAREALGAKERELSAVVASQRNQIRKLQEEIDRLKKEPPGPSPVPGPSWGNISEPPIQDVIDELPRHESKEYETRPRSDIDTLVIHHSATVPTITIQRIARYHVSNLDWPAIGYHFVVTADGTLYQGNPVELTSYHATKANPFGVGICFLGNFTEEIPPQAQLEAGAHLVAWLMQELDIDLENVKGHRHFTATSCPGRQWLSGPQWKQLLLQEVARVQQEAIQPEPLPEGKTIYHYVLFWARDGQWAERDWLNAQTYIATFRPSVGFRASDAVQAQNVTIVGGPLGVTKAVEDWLKASNCRVDRIAGEDEADTKRLLDELAETGRRFRSFDE